MKRFLLLFLLLTILPGSIISQTLIMNEVSNGPAGNQEYVEFVVVSNSISYDCSATTPPCIDIRGWIFDDNSGYHNSVGVAAGAIRFSLDPLWQCVPLGTIILIYNDADPNPDIPGTPDLSLADGDCRIMAPISSVALFETNSTTPGAVACSYPATGWTAGGNWSTTLLANGGDCARIVDLSGCEVFSLCWGTANANNLIYFAGSGQDDVWYFNDTDPYDQINWTEGCAGDAGACVGNFQTPGYANNAANAAYISQFNNGCVPITPIVASAIVDNNEICGCDGEATASGSGSIPDYTYEWLDDLFVPIGQTTATASGLCSGTYHVIVTSSIGCSDTSTISVNSGTVLQYTATIADETCGAADGQIELNATGGDGGPYQYSIDGGSTYILSGTFSGLSAGDYTISVLDNSGCEITGLETIALIGAPPTVNNLTPFLCEDSQGSGQVSGVNLTLNNTSISSELGLTFTWYTDAGLTTLVVNEFSETVTDGEIFYAEVDNGCGVSIATVAYTIIALPIADSPSDVTACDSYTLPALTVGNYFTGSGGTGTMLSAGASITSTQTIYVFAETGTTPNCTDENSFAVTINTTPIADAPTNVTACDSYILPALIVGNYFTGTGGTGTTLVAGTSITSTQTIYVYAATGTTPNCTDENSFVVTINTTPIADSPVDVTACDSYILPALTVGNYFSGSGGTGTMLVAGTSITSTQTIYVYAETGTTPNCTDENSFVVTINITPIADAPTDVNACDSYILPALTVGNYFTGSGGTGTMLAAGTSITSTQTIYVYAETSTIPNCTDENSFVVTINTTPIAGSPSDVTACDSYFLPALTVGNYFTGSGGTGTMLSAGASITSTQTIYVYAETGTTPNCTDENSFVVTINTTPIADSPADVTACDSYILPALTIGNYFPGSGGTGTMLAAGTSITSTQTIYVYAETGTIPNCTDENSFVVTINLSLGANDVMANLCENPAGSGQTDNVNLTVYNANINADLGLTFFWFTDPALSTLVADETNETVSNGETYYVLVSNGVCTDTAIVSFSVTSTIALINPDPEMCENLPGGTFTAFDLTSLNNSIYIGSGMETFTWYESDMMTLVGTPGNVDLTSSSQYWVEVSDGNCTNGILISLTVNSYPIADSPVDITACDSYILPALTVGNYFTGSGGTGTMLAAGTSITSTQTIYVYAETGTIPNCTDENSFVVTINTTPIADSPSDVTACDSYILPALSVGNYFTGSGGTGTMLVAGASITSTQTIYVYAETGTTPNCTDENSFVVTINITPIADAPTDVTACDSYILPALTIGNYFTGSGGTGTMLVAGASITSTQTIYVYAETGTVPNCTDENSFVVTINTTPIADSPVDVTACDLYILPALSVGNYFTGSGGTGTMLGVGTSITSTQTIYVYAETGTTPNCSDENSFVVTISTAPIADSPVDVTACDSYILPALTVGNYFTGSGGTGTMLAAGTSITSTQTIYVYAETGTIPNCTDENSFVVTINTTPIADAPTDVTACDSYILPALSVGNYFTGSGGTGTMLVAGASINSTQTIYVYAETGTTPNCTDENSFVVTISTAPIADSPVDVTACDSYILPALIVGGYFTGSGGTGTILGVGTSITSTQTIYVYAETGGTPNCTDENNFTTTITLTPDAPFAGTDAIYCSSLVPESMTASGSGGILTWYVDAALTDDIGTGETMIPLDQIGVTVYYVTESIGICEGPPSTVEITIEDCEIIVPTAFTPDGDQTNDVWQLVDLDEVYPNNVVIVYNRWGNVLYQSETGNYSSNPWDGTYKGEALPVGSYYFIIDFNLEDVEPLKGIVSIILQ